MTTYAVDGVSAAAPLADLAAALGICIPLIVVNCIILGRAEAYASENPPLLPLGLTYLQTADALSAALFLMGSEGAASFRRGSEGFDMLLVTADRQVIATDNLTGILETDAHLTVLSREM